MQVGRAAFQMLDSRPGIGRGSEIGCAVVSILAEAYWGAISRIQQRKMTY
jgi:hypothetical protein